MKCNRVLSLLYRVRSIIRESKKQTKQNKTERKQRAFTLPNWLQSFKLAASVLFRKDVPLALIFFIQFFFSSVSFFFPFFFLQFLFFFPFFFFNFFLFFFILLYSFFFHSLIFYFNFLFISLIRECLRSAMGEASNAMSRVAQDNCYTVFEFKRRRKRQFIRRKKKQQLFNRALTLARKETSKKFSHTICKKKFQERNGYFSETFSGITINFYRLTFS